jgi:hypothetical protein
LTARRRRPAKPNHFTGELGHGAVLLHALEAFDGGVAAGLVVGRKASAHTRPVLTV